MTQIIFAFSFLSFSFSFAASALEVLGPGGPAPSVKYCAEDFNQKFSEKVSVTAGPSDVWAHKATTADIIYSGSEQMMDSFVKQFQNIDSQTIKTHYLRPSAILVRPKNPKNIKGIKDLIDQPVRILVVNGAGQVAMWEDIVGRLKSARALNSFRRNIKYQAKNTGEAQELWKKDVSIDAWLVFNIWSKRNSENSQLVSTENELTIYRSFGTVITKSSTKKKIAEKFTAHLESPNCKAHFENQGWVQ